MATRKKNFGIWPKFAPRKKTMIKLAPRNTVHEKEILTSSCSSLILPRGLLDVSPSTLNVGADFDRIPRPYWLPHLRVTALPLLTSRGWGGDSVRLLTGCCLEMAEDGGEDKDKAGDGVRVPHTCSSTNKSLVSTTSPDGLLEEGKGGDLGS